MGNFAPTAQTLQPPWQSQLIMPATGMATPEFERYLVALNQVLRQISGIQVTVSGSDATSAIQRGIGQAITQGGGIVDLPVGFYTMGTVQVPADSPPIWIRGHGPATKLTRNVNLPPGVGMFDISSSDVTLSDFTIDGGTTVPVRLRYNADFSTAINANDPMAPSLTNNTSIWVHGPAKNFSFQRLRLQHAGGYSVLLDATSGDLSNIDLINLWLLNNRPTLFGITLGNLIFGSYNGGILAKGDGRTAMGAQSGAVRNLLVQGGNFERGNGNQLWSHSYGFARFHSNFRYLGNRFLDCGLDAILADILSGGTVEGNVMRRIGYTTLTDDDQSVPRWLANLNATGIDSGAVKGVNYIGNSLTSVNGGMIDLDTHCLGDVNGNICRIPFADEPDYIEDQIAITGPTNSGNGSYGVNLGVNYGAGLAEGGSYINIIANTLLNLPAGAMRLFSARNCLIAQNLIQAPDPSTGNPIEMGPQGAAAYNRCYANRISGNHIVYSPTGGSPTDAILESDALSGGNPMVGGDINWVFNNIIVGTGATEFTKAAGSGSTVYNTTVWFP